MDTKPERSSSPSNTQQARFLTNRFHPAVGIGVSLCVMVVLALTVNTFNVPNPNMILITGLVVFSSLFGFSGGITSAIVMFGYTLFFFSTDHSWVSFTDQNIQKVVISAIGIIVTTFFVSSLRLVMSNAFREAEQLAYELEEDNKLLEKASAVDELTGTHNRFALRRDYPNYLEKHLHVMMVDIDDFKNTNDTYGHQVGDFVLNQMGRILTDLFSHDSVYRYGGDEFLVICPETEEPEFANRVETLRERISQIHADDADDMTVHFSAGYVYGTPAIQADLRLMTRQADANLYESKNAGKDRVTGCAFSRSKAEAIVSYRIGAGGSAATSRR